MIIINRSTFWPCYFYGKSSWNNMKWKSGWVKKDMKFCIYVFLVKEYGMNKRFKLMGRASVLPSWKTLQFKIVEIESVFPGIYREFGRTSGHYLVVE